MINDYCWCHKLLASRNLNDKPPCVILSIAKGLGQTEMDITLFRFFGRPDRSGLPQSGRGKLVYVPNEHEAATR